MSIDISTYFERQITLSEIGVSGQEKLQKAKVLVVGCGGLGSPIAVYLATSGIGRLHLVDFDTISVSNLHRQVFYNPEQVDTSKVEVLAREITRKAPFTKVSYSTKAVEKEGVLELISDYDIVVDGTDNLYIKYLMNDACVLAKKPLIYGSLYKFDGYVAAFNIEQPDGSFSCNLRDAFPTIAKDVPNCEEAGTLNPIVGIIALLQVNEVVKWVTGKGKLLTDQLLIYNTLQNTQFKMQLKPNQEVDIPALFSTETYVAPECVVQEPDLLISGDALTSALKDPDCEVISVLNEVPKELPIPIHRSIPYKYFRHTGFEPDPRKKYIIVCKRGINSYSVTSQLKRKHPKLSVHSLSKGLSGLSN